MNVVISGAGGFLGSYLVKEFNKSRHSVIGIFNKTKPVEVCKDVSYVPAKELQSVKIKADIVIMSHASVVSGANQVEPQSLFDSNVSFTKTLVESFPDAYFIYVSSIAVYGNNENVITEHTPVSPQTDYAISKLWGENTVKRAKNFGILRLSSLYGEKMRDGTIIPNYVEQALKTGKIEVWGRGERKQNYVHVSDVVTQIKAMTENRAEGIFLGVSSKEFSNIELANIIACELNAAVTFLKTDSSFSIKTDNSYTRKELNIDSEKDFNTGIKEYILWKQK